MICTVNLHKRPHDSMIISEGSLHQALQAGRGCMRQVHTRDLSLPVRHLLSQTRGVLLACTAQGGRLLCGFLYCSIASSSRSSCAFFLTARCCNCISLFWLLCIMGSISLLSLRSLFWSLHA